MKCQQESLDLTLRIRESRCFSQVDNRELHILQILARLCSIEIAADLESQLEVFPKFWGFSPDGRLLHGTKGVAEPRKPTLSPPGSAEEGHASSSFLVAKARSARKTAKRSAPIGIAASSEDQCQAEFQATMLAHTEEFAGSPLKSAELLSPTSCSSRPAMLVPAASQKSSSPTFHEARTLLEAGACISRTRCPVRPVRAVPPEGDIPLRQPLDLAEALARLAGVLDTQKLTLSQQRIRSGSGRGDNRGRAHRGSQGSGGNGVQRLNGHAQVQRILGTRHECFQFTSWRAKRKCGKI